MSLVSPALRWRILHITNEVIRRRNTRLQPRRRLRAVARQIRDPIKDIPDAESVKTYRLGKAQVRRIIIEIRPFMPIPRRADGISIQLKVLIALSFYASGSYQLLVGQSSSHNVSQTTVSRAVVRQVTKALNHTNIYQKTVVPSFACVAYFVFIIGCGMLVRRQAMQLYAKQCNYTLVDPES